MEWIMGWGNMPWGKRHWKYVMEGISHVLEKKPRGQAMEKMLETDYHFCANWCAGYYIMFKVIWCGVA